MVILLCDVLNQSDSLICFIANLRSSGLIVDFDKEIRTLISDLTQTMLNAPGAGLAAPQIGK